MGAVAVGAHSHRLIGSASAVRCMTGRARPGGRRVAGQHPRRTDSDVRPSSCTVRGRVVRGPLPCPRACVHAGTARSGRRPAGSGGSRRSVAPSAACGPGRPRSGSRTGGTADAGGRARAPGTAVGDRALELPPRDPQQVRRVGDRVRRRPRPQPLREQRLRREDRADAGDDRLVEKHLGDRRRSSGGPATQRLVDVDRSRRAGPVPRWPMSVCSSRVRTTSSMPRWYPTVVHSRGGQDRADLW